MTGIARKKESPVLTFINHNLVLLGILLLFVVTAIIEPKFLGAENLTNVMRQLGPLPFVALGMTFVILGGFIDLSVVGVISLVSVASVTLIDQVGQVGTIVLCLLLGTFLGYLTGLVLTSAGAMIQAEVLFITYGMSSVYMAICLLFTGGLTLRLSRSVNPFTIFSALGTETVGIIPIVLIIFVLILIIMHIFHTKTLAGRGISLMGGNKTAAYLVGFNIKRSMRLVYAISGLMSAMGAIALVSRITTASATSGIGYETQAILCVVVGGTSLRGGKGSVLRTMLGVALITLLGNSMNMLNLPTYMQTVMRGAVLVLAIWLDNRKTL